MGEPVPADDNSYVDKLASGTRRFNFASERGVWYKDDDWVEPVYVSKYDISDPVAKSHDGHWGTAPANWPDLGTSFTYDVPDENHNAGDVVYTPRDSWWIWSKDNGGPGPNPKTAPVGYNYFRNEFGTGEKGNYAIFAASDDLSEVYLDGEVVLTIDDQPKTDNFATTHRYDVANLPAGPHVLAVRVYNRKDKAGLILALKHTGDPDKDGDAASPTESTTILATGPGEGWVVNGYPDIAPGWTPGEIMLKLLNEATLRGVRFPHWITPTFNARRDSANRLWPDPLDWEFDAGAGLDEVIQKMEEVACDVFIDPDTYEFNMYTVRGKRRDAGPTDPLPNLNTIVDMPRGVNGPLVFDIGKNLSAAEETGTALLKNTLLVQTTDGWTVQQDDDSTSVSVYGVIEGVLNTGATSQVSKRVATIAFYKYNKPQIGASYSIVEISGYKPFQDFDCGDYVLAPDAKKKLVSRRVMSISLSEDSENGEVDFAIEFDSIFAAKEAKLSKWLAAVGDQMLGGGVVNSRALRSSMSAPKTSGKTADIPAATTQSPGKVRFASSGDVAAGTSNDTVVTPAQLKTAVGSATGAVVFQGDWVAP